MKTLEDLIEELDGFILTKTCIDCLSGNRYDVSYLNKKLVSTAIKNFVEQNQSVLCHKCKTELDSYDRED